MKKKKILHIAQSAGGVAEYIYILIKNMNKEKYENFLICSDEYKSIQKINDLKINKYYVKMVRNINITKDIEAIKEIKKIIREVKPDIVYLHSSKAGGLGRLAISKRKVKIIYNSHGWYFNAQISKKKKMLYTVLEKILAINTDKIVNISESEYESAAHKKIANCRKMTIINNSIDFEKFASGEENRITIRNEYRIQSEDIVLGVVGRISEQKDPMTTIQVFSELCKKYEKLYCMFIGDGELKKDIIQYCTEKGIQDKVIITNWIENTEKYIPSIDIAMLPSKWEGFGLAILEYIAAKKPIVASEVGGIANILEKATFAKLVKSEDINGFINAIDQIIQNYAEFQRRINDEYEYYKEKYSIKKLENKHEKMFDDM